MHIRSRPGARLRYNATPTYCPGEPTAYFVGSNSHDFWDEDTKRYLPNTRYEDVYHPEAAPNMSAAGVGRYGVWKDALDASLLSNNCGPGSTVEGCPGEFNPDINLLDPSLDAARDNASLAAFAATVRAAGVVPFHFSRPCAEIAGATVTYDSSGGPVFGKGPFAKHVDLRDAATAARALERLAGFVALGSGGFYLDDMACPGDHAFLQKVRRTWPNLILMKEGMDARNSYLVETMPVIKLPEYSNHSVLAQLLRPLATRYMGKFDDPLTDAELDDALAGGAIGIVTQTYTPFLGDEAKLTNEMKGHISATLANQQALQDAYGRALGCPEPSAR